MTATGSTFTNNTTTGGEGGALANTAGVQVTDSTFNHNVAGTIGGAIATEAAGDVIILRSTFTKNVANNNSSYIGGGAIFANGGSNDISVTDSKFTYNSAVENGGAIEANGDSVDLLRSTFDHNTSVTGNGGAIDMGDIPATFTFTDSTFTYNTAKADGGAFNSEGGGIVVTGSVISGNTATNGMGGGFADEGTVSSKVTVTNSTISGNTAGGNGGGFTATGLTLTMSGSTVSSNRSGSEGGGIYILTTGFNSNPYPGSVAPGSLIINCTITGNGAAVDGGGITAAFGVHDLSIINDTIAFNSSATGGGIFTDIPSTIFDIHVGNTIVAKNNAITGPDLDGNFDDLGHNLFFSILGMTNAANVSDIIGQDPLLGPLANNGGPTKTLALLKHSPAINAADPALAPPVDQRGVSRPRDGGFDIGAYEKK